MLFLLVRCYVVINGCRRDLHVVATLGTTSVTVMLRQGRRVRCVYDPGLHVLRMWMVCYGVRLVCSLTGGSAWMR